MQFVIVVLGCEFAEDNSEAVGEVPDIGPALQAAALSHMEAAMDALSKELIKLRTGRASVGEAILHLCTFD